jgi:hypothetical protein
MSAPVADLGKIPWRCFRCIDRINILRWLWASCLLSAFCWLLFGHGNVRGPGSGMARVWQEDTTPGSSAFGQGFTLARLRRQ